MRDWRAERDDADEPGVPLDLGAHALVLDEPAVPATDPTGWAAPAAAVVIAIGWVGGALWLARGDLPGMSGTALVEFAAALASVPVLIGLALLAAQRSSRVSARRFGATAASLRAEADSLERTVATLAAAIDTNRVKLAEQAEQLAMVGTLASDRLGHLGEAFTGQIGTAQRQADALADVSHQAQATLSALLAALPRARAETEETIALLERAGAAADAQAERLDARIVELGRHGREADALATGAAERLAAHLSTMEATGDAAGARLEAVTGAMATSVDALLGRTAAAVEESRKGIAAQGDAMLAMVTQHQATLDHAARESAEALAARIEIVEHVIDRVATRLDAQRVAGDSLVSDLEDGIGRVEGRLDALHAQGVERSQLLAASISALGGSADAMTEALRAGEAMATKTIGTAESLLIALDAAAREIDDTLPDALARLDARIEASRNVVAQSKPELLALVTAAESTHEAIEAIATVIADQRGVLDRLSGSLAEALDAGRARADALGTTVEETLARAHRFAEDAAPRLVDALLRVRETASQAAGHARDTLASVIPQAADAIEAASADAVRRAAGKGVERQVAQLAGAADAAVAAADAAAGRLAERLREITDSTALVEARIEQARTEREETDRDSLARRVSLLIEALNSASIDLTKTLAPEVSDSAWAAYLKGDRGVFTRRAVRLLDAGEAREIARFYDENGAFREQVNRYIHDFEAMLRAVLAQRDGSPLGVTLLSSDMGKLYVALAQAIERLR